MKTLDAVGDVVLWRQTPRGRSCIHRPVIFADKLAITGPKGETAASTNNSVCVATDEQRWKITDI